MMVALVSKPLLIALTAHLAFLLYLLLVGAGIGRALRICLLAAAAGLGLSLVILFPLLFFLPDVVIAFAVLFNIILLPAVAFARARDVVVPGTSLVEVVFINVLVIMTAWYSPWLGYLLNPLTLLVPMDATRWTMAIGLWPTAIALLLAWRGPPGDSRLRVLLGAWTQLVGIMWLFPTALRSIEQFDAASMRSYLSSVIACLACVHVAMSYRHILELLGGPHRRETRRFGSLVEQTGESVSVPRMHPLMLLGLGLLWAGGLYLWLSVRPIEDATLLILGAYVAAMGLTTTLSRHSREGEPQAMAQPAPVAARTKVDKQSMRELALAFRANDESAKGSRSSYSYFWRFMLAAIALLLARIYGAVLSGTEHAQLLPMIRGLGALAVLPLALVGVWVIAESLGRAPTARQRHWIRLIGVLAIIVWQAVALSRLDPQGQYDGWQATTDARDPPPAAAAAIVQIARAQSPCRPIGDAKPALFCGDAAVTLGSVPHPRESGVPSTWDVDAARYYRLDNEDRDVLCIEIPATGRLADGRAEMGVAVVFVEPRARIRRYWLMDREGSCSRAHSIRAALVYDWHPTISAYVGQSRSQIWKTE